MQFVDLGAQYARYRAEIDASIAKVLSHGAFINGPEIEELEQALSSDVGAKHMIGCSSGTDAILLMMMADNIGPGDAIFLPSFTFTATAEVPLLIGATPVFVDVDENSFNIDCESLINQIQHVRSQTGLVPRGVLATDIFGLPANYDEIHAIAKSFDLTVWADAAQSLGAKYKNQKVGALARATATSFFPAKPLGCYGDGGAVFTDDQEMVDAMRSIRSHGKGTDKYDIQRLGLNARLDTLQAAILLAKLPHFANEITERDRVSRTYDHFLSGHLKTPTRYETHASAWAQYTVRVPQFKRASIIKDMKENGIPTAVYYPTPMHLQTAYTQYGQGPGSLPISEQLCLEVLSLPMHPFLTEEDIHDISKVLLSLI
jgi:dTDP-4-amino-4,6-dideoxygalactose transaminase